MNVGFFVENGAEMNPNELIARVVKRERESLGISLSALAKTAGLSKSTLSQIEAGKANPNIETLWALASVLELPVSSFFESADLETRVLRRGQGNPIPSENKDMETILLSKSPQMRRRDLYFVTVYPDGAHVSEPHSPGTTEHAFALEGQVGIGPVGKTEILNPGDYFRFPADISHEYYAVDKQASFILVIESHY